MNRMKTAFKFLLAILMVGAGITHFVNPGFFRTELLTDQSTRYAAASIPDYDARRGPLQEYWQSLSKRHLEGSRDGYEVICYAGMPRWLFAIAAALFLLVTYRDNLRRILAGGEARMERARVLHRIWRGGRR